MERYREYRPTGFDPAGIVLDERQDWFVLPVGINRDSNTLAHANWESVIKHLGGESETLEVHRFGHWACGWFEIALLHPDREDEGDEIEKCLEDYPVFDEDLYSELEYEACCNYWRACSLHEKIEICFDNDVSIFSARREDLPSEVYLGVRNLIDY